MLHQSEGKHAQIGQLIRTVSLLLSSAFFAYTAAPGQGFQSINAEAVRKSVVFIYATCDPSVLSVPPCPLNAEPQSDGTGFLVSVPHKGGGDYVILVTARHIVDPAWDNCPPQSNHLSAHFNNAEYDPTKDDVGYVDLPLSNSPDDWKFSA